MLDPLNVELMRGSGTTVLLDVAVDLLVARVADAADRPMVSGDPERLVREIASARAESYRRAADIVVDGDGSVEEVVDRVEAACNVL